MGCLRVESRAAGYRVLSGACGLWIIAAEARDANDAVAKV